MLEIAADMLPRNDESKRMNDERKEAHPSSVNLPHSDGPETLESLERNYILRTLDQTNWLINGPRGAAQILGLHPNTLRNRMKKLGVSRK
jgi:transcriptional regulator with GAF, ATPase, and Fis domain